MVKELSELGSARRSLASEVMALEKGKRHLTKKVSTRDHCFTTVPVVSIWLIDVSVF